MHIRDREFDPFAFRINDNALPEVMDGYVFQQPSQDRNFPLTELTEQQHRERHWRTVSASRLYKAIPM